MKNSVILLLSIVIWFDCATKENEQTKTIIAFGSCSHQNNDEQLWDNITAENTDLFVFLGDVIYGDTQDMTLLKAKYDRQKSRDSYQKLMISTPIIGVWDDHDYGINDGGKYYAKKDSSKQLLLDFFDVPTTHEVYQHDGAYGTYTFSNDGNDIEIYLLDTRYFRDTLAKDTTGNGRYIVNHEGDILGEQQWQWLEKNLKNSTADLNIIASSIQVIAEEHRFEKWANFPKARKRLLDLIEKANAKNTVVISGDRHIAELSKIELSNDKKLYDFTSSGLTHTWSEVWEEPNQYRTGELVIAKNYGLLAVDWEKGVLEFIIKGDTGNTLLTHSAKIEL
ncbi:MAG: alkaline phosphatase D family protein [Fulvivirga sp.]